MEAFPKFEDSLNQSGDQSRDDSQLLNASASNEHSGVEIPPNAPLRRTRSRASRLHEEASPLVLGELNEVLTRIRDNEEEQRPAVTLRRRSSTVIHSAPADSEDSDPPAYLLAPSGPFDHPQLSPSAQQAVDRTAWESFIAPTLPTTAQMSSYYSGFFDNGTPAPRNPPSQSAPGPSQQSQQNGITQPSGVNGGPANGINGGGAVGGPNGAFVPTPAGHQSDLNYIWEQMESLSALLKNNREGIDEIMGRATETTERLSLRVGENTEIDPETAEARIAELAGELLQLRKEHGRKGKELGNTKELLEEALSCIAKLVEMIRKFAYENQMHIAGIHRSYQEHLNREREINMELRNVDFERQARVVRICGYLREASRIESERPWHREMASLKFENRILKKTLGWEVSDSEDEDDDAEEPAQPNVEPQPQAEPPQE